MVLLIADIEDLTVYSDDVPAVQGSERSEITLLLTGERESIVDTVVIA
jgi:hypothetical protein